MEGFQGTTASTACTAGGGSSGPAPFLLKTYDMVDDSSTDEIVSWSSSKTSFVVWNPPEFARLLLPTYFKHNNFSSFIRQLNTYGFRKIDSEKWEFANEDFVKDQKHLLKNIHRRKPIHSHSQPQGPLIDPERAGFEEEMEQLSRDKAALEAKVSSFKEQRSSAKLQLDELSQRIGSIEKRQESLLIFVEKAFKNPLFIEHFARRVESMDFAAYNKKRRLPEVTCLKSAVEGSFVDAQSNSKSEFGNIFDRDFSSKLRLELSPTVSIINLVSNSTQSSNEDGGSLHRKTSEDEGRAQMRTEGIGAFMTEALELSDTETSFGFKMDSSLSRKVPTNGSPRLQSLQPNMTFNEEGDGRVACHLNLTLASSSLQVSNNPYSAKISLPGQEPNKTTDSRFSGNSKQPDVIISAEKNNITDEQKHSSSKEDANTNHGSAPAKANDFFWEQFLTERPGCSENEEASSNYRAKTCDDPDDGRLGCGISRSARNVEQLKL